MSKPNTFIVAKEPLARWYQVGEEVEITDEQEVRNLLRDGRINVPPESDAPTPEAPTSDAPVSEQPAE